MRGVPWRSLTLALIGGILVAVAVVPDPSLQNLSNWSTPELIAALDSDRPAVRRAVVRQLVARSKTVVPALESAADLADEGRLSGLCEVLEELLLSSNSEAAENAEAALERMSRSRFQPQVSDAAVHVLNSNVTLRHARALSKYLEAGGQFPRGRSTRWPVGLDRAMQPTQLLQSRILILNEQWTGGDAGLQYVARVFPGEPIALHVASGVPVSKAALDQLLEVRRNTIIRREHESCLGIMVDPRNDFGAVRISDVVPLSPAAQAGLRRNDYLFQLGEAPIHSFADLREQAALHPPGERVVIFVRRGNREIRFKMPLGSDFGTGECRCPTAETHASAANPSDAVN